MWNKFKTKFIGDRNFYKHVLCLAIPMIVQNAITNFVSFLDNIMVGQIGTEQMSGVAIVNQLMFVFYICIFGGVSGAGIFGTQFYGKGDYEGQKYSFRYKVYTCTLITGIAVLLFTFCNTELISLYLRDTGNVGDISLALSYGKQYLAVMVIGLIPFSISQSYISTIRETGQTFVPMLAGIVAVFTNLILDYVLIFGVFGFPVLGVVGAGIATVISRFIECLIVVIWTHMNKNKNPYIKGAYRSFYIPAKVFKDITIKGTPLMINEMLWASGMAFISQRYALRGLEVVAALNISSTITNLFNIIYLQLGSCIAIIVGQYLGAGKIKEARDSDTKLVFFSVACCSVVALLMSFVGRFFPAIYNTENSIKELAKQFITVCAIVMPLNAFSHAAYFTLRSGGKTLITFLFDSVYTWVLIIPFTIFLVNFTDLSITTVFLLVSFSEIVKVCIGFFMIRSDMWMQNIVNEKPKKSLS